MIMKVCFFIHGLGKVKLGGAEHGAGVAELLQSPLGALRQGCCFWPVAYAVEYVDGGPAGFGVFWVDGEADGVEELAGCQWLVVFVFVVGVGVESAEAGDFAVLADRAVLGSLGGVGAAGEQAG